MARVYQPRRHSLRPQSSVDMPKLLAAREDVCNVVKTSSGSSREKTVCAVNKVRGSFCLYRAVKSFSFSLNNCILCSIIRF